MKNKLKDTFVFYQGEEREKGEEKKIVHRCHITPIHCEDLGEPLPIPPWMIVFVSPRSLHTPPERRGLLLAGICTACANTFFSFYFFNLSKDHSPLPNIISTNKPTQKYQKKPFNASYIFFCLQ
jgi:hypothetical protein